MVLPLINLTFNDGVPFGTNSPSIDQPEMLANNVSNFNIWDVDHIGFNVNGSGYHQQVRMPNYTLTPITPIPPVIAGMGGTYCDNTSSQSPSTETGLWYTPDASGDKYQLTRTITGSFALFGKNTNDYNGQGIKYTGGWTFLPGGLLFQYGTYLIITGIPANDSVPFPVKFNSTPFNVSVTPITKNVIPGSFAPEHVLSVANGTVTDTLFKYQLSQGSSSNYFGFYWTAIGI